MFLLIMLRITLRSFSFVSLIPACKHCLTAASQALREKMNVIAGSKPSLSSFSITSGLLKLFGAFGLSRQFPRT